MERETVSILISTLTLVVLVVVIIILFVVFQNRKNKLIKQKKQLEQRKNLEIARAKNEIGEEIFRNISWELHDNIGQLLTLAKIQLQSGDLDGIAKDTLNNALKEVRALSKMMNANYLNKIHLKQALEQEIERFNRLNYIEASLNIKGSAISLDDKAEIVIFRILQEFFSNTLKHAKASELIVNMAYTKELLSIQARDNGIGFNINEENIDGIGLSNIKTRAELVNAKVKFESKPNQGTKISIDYPLNIQ